MSDRPPPPYSLLPPNFSNNMLQQQHHQQQQQQQQQQPQQQHPDSHPGPGFADQQQQRMWQQMQQMQQQFRPRSGAGVAPPSTAAQMNDLMRGQNMSRVPGGQQQAQLPFGMGVGVPNMGGGGAGMPGPSQQQVFHDPSSNQASGNNIATNFPMSGMPNNNVNAAALQQRTLLQGLPPANMRQLDLIMAQQNQNNATMNFAKFNQQQQQRAEQQQQQQQAFMTPGVNHSSPGDMFSSPGMSNEAIRRPSPSHPMQPGPAPVAPGNQLPPGQPQNTRRVMTPAELNDRANQLRLMIQNQENMIHSINMQVSMRGGMATPEIAQRLKQLNSDVILKKDYLAKIVNSLSIQNPQAMAQQGNVPPALATGINGGGGPPPASWIPQTNSSQPFDNSQSSRGPPGQNPMQQQPPQVPNGGPQASPSLGKPQAIGNHLMNQGAVPPRNSHTPHQQVQQSGGVAPPFQMPMAPNMNGQHPFPINGGQVSNAAQMQQMNNMNNVNMPGHPTFPPPLDKIRFDATYKNFCMKKGVKLNHQMLQIENRLVDLHLLHKNVIQEGGWNKIEQSSSWDIIAARLGFVQFPGSDTEPAKSGPGVAQQIANIYKEFLHMFDQFYIQSVMESRIKMQNTINAANASNANHPAGPSQPGRWTPQQTQQVVSYAHVSVAELRQQGVSEKTIQFVETNRANLQRAHQDQLNFQDRLRMNGPQPAAQANNQANADQPGGPMGPPGSQPPSFGVPGQNHMIADRRMLPHGVNPMEGTNFMDNRQQAAQQQQQQQLAQQQRGGGMAPNNRPTSEQMQLAMAYIAKVRHDFTSITIPNMPARDIPPEQRASYNQMLEQLFRQTSANEPKLPMFFVLLKNEDLIKKLIAITCTVAYQRNLLSSGNPRHIISLDTLRGMMAETQRLNEAFMTMFQNVFPGNRQTQQQQAAQLQQLAQAHHHQQQQQQLQQQLQQHPMNNMSPPGNHPNPDMSGQARPPGLQQQPPPAIIPQQQQPQHPPPQNLRPAIPLQQPPIRRNQKTAQQNASATPAAVSSPSPAPIASASTPVSAPTPTGVTASPQAPKSPKGKAPAKGKAQTGAAARRRASKTAVVSPAAPPPAAATPAATVPAPPSQASPEAMSTPVQAPASVKRPRDEDTVNGNFNRPSPAGESSSSTVANGPSPPKRVKLEPEPQPQPPTEPARMNAEIVESVKTDEEAANFLDHMTTLIQMASNGEGQTTLSSDIKETLEMLLKGYSPLGDSGEGSSSMGLTSDFSNHREPSPPPSQSLFDEFFDFSNMPDDEDPNSKADTPELVSSSSTNPSPESNSETDAAHHALTSATSMKMENKMEDFSDALRLGPWKEIDGGEAAYFQSSDWKWDSPMTSLEPPWAIYNP